jgi:hypothetical protein
MENSVWIPFLNMCKYVYKICGSSFRVPALQAWSPEFTPHPTERYMCRKLDDEINLDMGDWASTDFLHLFWEHSNIPIAVSHS